jgi:streptogramin lyase
MKYFLRVPALSILFLLVGCGISGGVTDSGIAVDPNLPLASQTLSGKAMDGQQPIAGAHVYLLAANTSGYGNASVSLLLADSTGYADWIGAYVLTASDGSFSIRGTYHCAAGNQQTYLYVLGGDAGLGTNSAIGELVALGDCPSLTAPVVPSLTVNEVTTIAAAYAIAGYAVDATHVSSSGTSLAQTGIANAFANADNLASISSGVALTMIPSGNATVPQTTINTLANILAACVHSAGATSSGCSALLSNALTGGVTTSDTASAALYIAHSPAIHVQGLYSLQANSSPYTPGLIAVPNDFSIGLSFNIFSVYVQCNLAVDSEGNVWYTNSKTNQLFELSSNGYLVSGEDGYTDGLYAPGYVAIDQNGNIWVDNYFAAFPSSSNPYSLFEFASSGELLSGPNGYMGGGIYGEGSISVDGMGNVWTTNTSGNHGTGNSVSKFSSSGLPLSGNGFTGGSMAAPVSIATDGTGNAWVISGNSNSLIKLSSSGSILSGSNGFTNQTNLPFTAYGDVQVDSKGNVWVANGTNAIGSSGPYSGSVVKYSNSGDVLSGTTGYTGNGTVDPSYIAIDGAGNIWAPNYLGSSVAELSNSGQLLSGTVGYTGGILGFPGEISIDGSGDVWVINGSSFYNTQCTELIGIAVPVITPISAGLPATPTADGSSKLGTRP